LGSGAGYITAVAAGIAREVRAFEANPAMVEVGRATLARNRVSATIENAVVERAPKEPTVPFYVASEFVVSSLKPSAVAHRIEVPTRDLAAVCDGCSYLVVDIEGAEVDLLREELPGIRAICVETHPSATGLRRIAEMLTSLFEQGFTLDVEQSRKNVLYLQRG
jgi:FkbM family methyltransferase